jgi:hypothetical protein
MSTSSTALDCRCRCGCLLAKVSVPVAVSFDVAARGIEIRCRRCKSHAVLVPALAVSADDELRAAE